MSNMIFPIALDRPLVIFDIEATGLSPRADRIVELAAIRINPDGSQAERTWLINPTIPIPVESTAIHGITDADVADAPTFEDVALEIYLFFGADSDLGGFAAGRFDIPLLAEEFSRVDIQFKPEERRLLDAQRIYHVKEPRDLGAALQFYCNREHTDAHGALADTKATLDVILGQFQRYPELPHSMPQIDTLFNQLDPLNVDRAGRFRWFEGQIVVNFGKKKGAKLKELVETDPGFIKWIIKNDFPQDTRKLCEDALKGIYPKTINVQIKAPKI